MSVADHRRPPFAWIALQALERVRREVPMSQQRGARNALLALAEAASRRRDGHHKEGDTLRDLAAYGCVSERRMRDQLQILAAAGLVCIEEARDAAGRDLPTTYILIGGDESSAPSDEATSAASSAASAPTRARQTRREEKESKKSTNLIDLRIARLRAQEEPA
jgi:hypothetical protein